MQTPEEIIEIMDQEAPYEIRNYLKPYIKEAMEIFGKQCFEAGREEIQALSGPNGLKYNSFENYLKSLEDDTKETN